MIGEHDWSDYPRAWKIVDEKDASKVAEGRLRLGTFASYAKLENGRADALEGASIIYADEAVELRNHPVASRRASTWLPNPPRGLSISSCRLIEQSPPTWVYCMSEPGCDFDWTPEKPKAIFEIADASILAGLAVDLLRRQIENAYFGRVTYRPRTSQLTDDVDFPAHPFHKDPYYRREREARIVFAPRPGVEPRLPLYTPPHPVIASLFKRIR